MRKFPNFAIERLVWRKGFKVVAGADEVGRGAWVGPVVASAVAFAPIFNFQFARKAMQSIFKQQNIRVDDSKKLSVLQREKAEKWIKENALSWGIGEVSASVVNKIGISKASNKAFRAALVDLNKKLKSQKVDFLLIDAFYLPFTKGIRRKNQLAIIDGDAKSFSIATSSIIAKVQRDKIMQNFARKHPMYSWEKNKGYGTKKHQEAIRKYGLTRLHRKSFVPENLLPL